MSEIKTFLYNTAGIEDIKSFPLGTDWPVVYIIEDGKNVYIGETTSAWSRSRQHLTRIDRASLERMHVIVDEEFNKSATLDIESLLIQYFAAENTFHLLNGNKGLVNHSYYDRDRYRAKLESTIWKKLQEMLLVKRDLQTIRNSEVFKYSPYKALTDDQLLVVKNIQAEIVSSSNGTHIINGGPGTGKTVLATYLVKALRDGEQTKHLKIGMVVPMSSLRDSIREVFSQVHGLSGSMVIGPSDVVKTNYDILIVDEAHRLRQRRNIVNYASHDRVNKELNLSKEGTELDWIVQSSKHQVLFYDEGQNVRPADILTTRFKTIDATHHHLTSQMRVEGGDEYMAFVDNLLSNNTTQKLDFINYDFKIYTNLKKMVEDIKTNDSLFGLSRLVAGYAWDWITRRDPNAYDIQINDVKLKWNSRLSNWVNSPNAVNEVGCIHTVQGYDLNYVGVIVGPELSYSSKLNKLVVNQSEYKDANGWRGTNPEELEVYILNIYKTLMTRGIKGCYVYFVDKNTENYFKEKLGITESHG